MMKVIKKGLIAIMVLFSIHLCIFSINQWRSENSYPIQRSFLRKDAQLVIPDHTDAERITRSISLLPGIDMYHVLLGKYYVWGAPKGKDMSPGQRRGLLEAARREYLEALYLNPAYTEVLGYLAWVEFALGETAKATGRLETAIKLAPNNFFNHLFYGICVSRFLDRIPERLRKIYLYRAEEEFKKGLALNPSMATHPSVLISRAELYLKKGDLAHAVRQMEKIGRPDIQTLPYHLKLASSYMKLGREKAGVKKYGELLENPDIDGRGVGIITSSLKRQSEIYPDNIEIRFLLGRAHFKEKNMEAALEALKEVVRARPDAAEAYYLMGQTYESMGDEDASYGEYLKTLKYSNNHPEANKKVFEHHRRRASEGESQVP